MNRAAIDADSTSPPYASPEQAVMHSNSEMDGEAPPHHSKRQPAAKPARAHGVKHAEHPVVPTTEETPEQSTADAPDEPTDAVADNLLHPKTSERKYWREPFTGIQREIWRPGMSITLYALTGLMRN